MPNFDTFSDDAARVARPNGDHRAPDISPDAETFPDAEIDCMEVRVHVWTKRRRPRLRQSAALSRSCYFGAPNTTLH